MIKTSPTGRNLVVADLEARLQNTPLRTEAGKALAAAHARDHVELLDVEWEKLELRIAAEGRRR